jgi:hypothetical protein
MSATGDQGAGYRVGVSTVVLSSPRMRRRLVWAAAIVGAIVAVIVAVELLPTHSTAIQREPTVAATPTTATEQPVQATGEPRTVKPPRQELNALLDAFVPAVIARRDLTKGWDLVTPDARGSRADWMRGDTQFQRFDARIERYHGWTVNYSYPGDVGFDILLQPRDKTHGAWSFRAEAQKIGGAWKMTTWYPVATFAPPGKTATVLGPNDIGPSNGSAFAVTSRLSAAWLLLPGAVVGLAIAGALGFALAVGFRRRARVRAIERDLAQLR